MDGKTQHGVSIRVPGSLPDIGYRAFVYREDAEARRR